MKAQTISTIITCAVFALGSPAVARAADAHQDHHGGHSTSAAKTPHRGQVQHTGARAYELVRHERSAMLFLYTHMMEPVAVRGPAGSTTKDAHAHRPSAEGVEASGTATVIRADGSTSKAHLAARTDAMSGVTHLQVKLPPALGDDVTIRCEVRVAGHPVDTVTFTNPAIVPMHGHD